MAKEEEADDVAGREAVDQHEGARSAPDELERLATGAQVVSGERLSELELGLTVLWNSIRRWINQRSKAGEFNSLSELDVFLLHLLVYRGRPMRLVDLAFALSVDDVHQVTYSLKKLTRLDLVSGVKSGKEIFYSALDQGRRHYEEFLQNRRRFLEPSMSLVFRDEHDLEVLINLLRTISGVYEQAARSAASSRGGFDPLETRGPSKVGATPRKPRTARSAGAPLAKSNPKG